MKCPGQDSRYWKPGAIFEANCPKCGKIVEFFKDDTSRRCAHCDHRFPNPRMDFGCAAYCPFAEQCIGTLPPGAAAAQENLLKDRVALEMKRYLGKDFKRISHMMRTARHAERIGRMENGNLAAILSAAYLQYIAVPEAACGHGGGPECQEEEDLCTPRSILARLGAKEALIDAVCSIIGRRRNLSSESETIDFKVVHDAGRIADLEDGLKTGALDPAGISSMIETAFLTGSGKEIAKEVLSRSNPS